jgi:hypothetical protein
MKPVPHCPGYFASEDGHIFRNGSQRKPRTNGRGYLRIKVSVNNAQWDEYVHRMVCAAYHGPCPDGFECRHLDGNRQHNSPSNLEWADKATNERDKIIHGTILSGERNGQAELTDAIVIEARRRAAAGERIDHIAASFGVNRLTLGQAIAGKRWKHLPGGLGSFSTRRKFKPDGIVRIRREYASGRLQRDIAAEYGVNQTAIGAIVRREAYPHISDAAENTHRKIDAPERKKA